jgi:hypothetical protein
VADDHVADRGIGRERGIELRARDRLGPRQLERRKRHADRRGNLPQARAVEAVVDDQHLALARHQRAEHRLIRGIADALHRHADVTVLAVHQSNEALAHLGREREEIGLVRREIAQHGLPGRGMRGHRAGRQDDPLVVLLGHVGTWVEHCSRLVAAASAQSHVHS